MTAPDITTDLGLSGWPEFNRAVETAMQAALAGGPPTLVAPARRLLAAGGKRLRPALVLAAATASGRPVPPAAVPAAAAIELVHAGTLIHDDIIDQADTRRGVPTVSAQEGSHVALLAGDYLLAQAGVLAAGVSREAAGVVAATVVALVDGQARELATQYDPGRTVAAYRRSVRGKTAALLAAACHLGGHLAGLRGRRLEALATYGAEFGLSFQLADDLADLPDDVAAGVYNLPVLLALRGSSAGQIRPMLGRRPARRLDAARLMNFLEANGYLAAARAEIARHNARAAAALASAFPPSPAVAKLAEFPIKCSEYVMASSGANTSPQ